jgi:hypothetical protein
MILANSFETRESLLKLMPSRAVDVLGNPAPDYFLRPTRPNYPLLPGKILVVSNHVPEDLANALKLYKSKHTGVVIDHFGLGGTQRLVEPTIITRYDLVITIGKTVQYSIASCVPVYCYDRFGGPGFLSSSNFITAAWWNFSGRGFSKNSYKSSKRIVSDIEDNYQKKAAEFSALHEKYADEILLSKRLKIILDNLQKHKPRSKTINDSTRWISEQFISLFARETKARFSDYDDLIKIHKKNTDRLHNEKIESDKKLNAAKYKIKQQNIILNTKLVKLAQRLQSIIHKESL